MPFLPPNQQRQNTDFYFNNCIPFSTMNLLYDLKWCFGVFDSCGALQELILTENSLVVNNSCIYNLTTWILLVKMQLYLTIACRPCYWTTSVCLQNESGDSFYHTMHYSAKHSFEIACHLSVHLSVCLSVCDVVGSWPHRLKILETNRTNN